MLYLRGKLVADLTELSAMRRADLERFKAWITLPVDEYRAPYARLPVLAPRRFVLMGTTNEYQYLTDTTGNRRFIPVRCGEINLSYLRECREQLFAEAVVAYRDGYAFHELPLDKAKVGAGGARADRSVEPDPGKGADRQDGDLGGAVLGGPRHPQQGPHAHGRAARGWLLARAGLATGSAPTLRGRPGAILGARCVSCASRAGCFYIYLSCLYSFKEIAHTPPSPRTLHREKHRASPCEVCELRRVSQGQQATEVMMDAGERMTVLARQPGHDLGEVTDAELIAELEKRRFDSDKVDAFYDRIGEEYVEEFCEGQAVVEVGQLEGLNDTYWRAGPEQFQAEVRRWLQRMTGRV